MADLKSLGHDVAIHGGRKSVASWAEMLGDQSRRGEEARRMPRRLAALHVLFPLAGGLVGVLGTVVEGAVLAVLHARQDLLLRGALA